LYLRLFNHVERNGFRHILMKAMNQNRLHILAEEILIIDGVTHFVFHKTQTESNKLLIFSLIVPSSFHPSIIFLPFIQACSVLVQNLV